MFKRHFVDARRGRPPLRPLARAAAADPARRFRFSYPASFGEPSPGTNDGIGDRVAAFRFSVFSSGIGGEAALTSGFPVIDLQAAGGLYDANALEVFPEAIVCTLRKMSTNRTKPKMPA